MKYNVIKINIESKYYPEKLKRIDNPPKELFCIGNLELMRAKSIAIIGSRDYSNYGKRAAKDFSYNLAKNNICIDLCNLDIEVCLVYSIPMKSGDMAKW